jgi:hypothetical protein
MQTLIIVENPYQTLIAVILQELVLTNEQVDILLTDRSSGALSRRDLINTTGIFRNVFFCFSSECNKNNTTRKKVKSYFAKARCLYCGCKKVDNKEVFCILYDRVFTLYPQLCISNEIISNLQRRKHSVEVNVVEEGFNLYTGLGLRFVTGDSSIFRRIFVKICNHIKRVKPASSLIKYIWYFQPEKALANIPWEKKRIPYPNIENSINLKKLLNTIFNYENQASEYNAPVIFLENCAFQDMGMNDDLEIVKIIADLVGRENIIVKLHPRTSRNRFEPLGIRVSSAQELPWEILVMNMDSDSKKLFISVSSGSVISYKMLFNKSFQTIMLFKLLPPEFSYLDEVFKIFLEKFAAESKGTVSFPSNIDQLKSQIYEYLGDVVTTSKG